MCLRRGYNKTPMNQSMFYLKLRHLISGLGITVLLVGGTAGGADMDPRDAQSPYGVLAFLDWNHDWNDQMYNTPMKIERAAAMMQKGGIRFVRQVISWDEVEQAKGKFDFSKYDQILDTLEEHDLRTLGVLCYTATWTGKEWNSAPDP